MHASPSFAEEALQALLTVNVERFNVVGMGHDAWGVARQLVPRLGPHGTYAGFDIDADTVAEARKRYEGRKPEEPVVTFHEIEQDLRLSKSTADAVVASRLPKTLDELGAVQRELGRLREEQPLVADASADLVVATGLRFLPSPVIRARMLQEFHRVLKRNGQLMVVDVVSDEAVPAGWGPDTSPELGRSPVRCFNLLDSLATVGFYGIELLRRDSEPWRESAGIEFRRVAVGAQKGKEGPCWEHFQAVMYRGPFKNVEDDDGHVYERGQQTAVCKKTFEILQRDPYRSAFEYSEPRISVATGQANPFPCNLPSAVRDPRQLKRAREHADPPPKIGRRDGADGTRKSLTVFTRSGQAVTSPAYEFGQYLSQQYGDQLETRVVDLAKPEDAPVPAQLRFRMSVSGDACLPALVLDGVVVTVGTLPGPDELRKLIAEGRPPGALPFDRIGPRASQSADCDTPGCC